MGQGQGQGWTTNSERGQHVTFVLYKRLFRTITTRVEGHQRGLDIFEYRHSQEAPHGSILIQSCTIPTQRDCRTPHLAPFALLGEQANHFTPLSQRRNGCGSACVP